MSGFFRTIGKIAAVVATVAAIATGFGAVAVAGVSLATIGAVASAVAVVSNLAAGGPRPPPARGNVSQLQIGSNLPTPVPMGRTALGGMLVSKRSYGATLNDVPNPYRATTIVLSGVRIDGLEATLADLNPVTFSGNAATDYFASFLYRDTQLGLSPESNELQAQWAGEPDWGASHKLSGKAAVKYSLLFDRDGKRFAAGEPAWLHVVRGAFVYDMRLDSTFPGGSGSCRINDETTWVYNANPACHAVSYAYGRRQNGVLVFGPGYSAEGIDLTAAAAWANVCDANNWQVGGVIYEPGDPWANLKYICQAGGCDPVAEPVLTFNWRAPRVSVATITRADFLGEADIPAMRSSRNRKNAFVPEFRSEDHGWEFVQGDEVSDAGYVTEDGEKRPDVARFELVQDMQQAAELAAYRLVEARESDPITLPLKPRFMDFKIGQQLTVGADLNELGLAGQDLLIIGKSPSVGEARTTLTLVTETDGKHDFAMGVTGTAPPTPTIRANEDMDQVAGGMPLDWDQIYGPGKPEDNANVGDNLLANPNLIESAENWTLAGTASRIIGGSPWPATGIFRFTNGAGLADANNGDLIPIGDVSRLYASATAYRDSGATGSFEMVVYWYKADGSAASVVQSLVSLWPQSGVHTPISGSVDRPTDAAFCRFRVNAATSGSGNVYAGAFRLAKTEPAADVTLVVSPASVTATPPIARATDGSVKSGELPRDFNFKLLAAGADVTTAASWSAAVKSGAATFTPTTGTPNTTGTVNVTACSDGAVLTVSATYKGKTRTAELALPSNIDPPPTAGGGGSGGAGSASDNTITNTTGTSYGSANSDVLTVTAGSGGSVALSFPGQFRRSIAGNNGAYGKWQWKTTSGGSWADVASEIHSSLDCERIGGSEPSSSPGSIEVSMNKSSLTAGVSYDFQLLLRNDDAVTNTWQGTASAVAS